MFRTKRRKLLLILLALGFVGWLGTSGMVAWVQTHRRQPPFSEPAPQLDSAVVREHRLVTSDGERIGAWLVRGGPGRGCVLLLHGNRSCRRSMLPLIRFLAEQQVTAMAISLRAHGDSTGQVNDLGYSARRDVIAAVEYLQSEFPHEPVFVLGRSLGAAAALFAAEELGDRVAGYFLEAPYKDLRSAVWNRMQYSLPPILDAVGYAGLRLWSGLVLPVDFDAIAPSECARHIPRQVPVVVVASSADRRCPLTDVRQTFDRVRSHGELVVFDGATHDSIYSSNPARYHETLVRLLQTGSYKTSVSSR